MTLLSVAGIEAACQEITALVLRQCRYGAQSADLSSQRMAACGQFLQEPGSRQRGIHGSAAALRVLASASDSDSRDLTSQLVSYIFGRQGAEQVVGTEDDRGHRLEVARLDEHNVIKLGEVLYALKFVPASVEHRQDLIDQISASLRKEIIEGRGWTYFLGDGGPPEPLPTSFAILGLDAHSFEVSEPARYLMDVVREAGTDIFVSATCLLALVRLSDRNRVRSDLLNEQLAKVWSALEALVDHDFEATIDYSWHDYDFYVRIPWSLYLIAALAENRPRRLLSSWKLTKRLSSIVSQTTTRPGFSYQSGSRVSARTNAILFDALQAVAREFPQHRAPTLMLWYDRMIIALHSRRFSRAAAAIGIVGSIVAIIDWQLRGGASVAQLGPAILSGVLLLLISGLKAS